MSETKALMPPRLLAWESTRACNLVCRHCRAEAVNHALPGELNHEEGLRLLKEMAAWSPSTMIILTGGEPLMRDDILELAAFGHSLGLRMLMSPNGTLVDGAKAKAMKKAGLARVSLSLDAPTAQEHDDFRQVKGSYNAVCDASRYLREAGLPFQINSTLTAQNLHQAEDLALKAESLGAVAWHVFLLVPVGRGENIANHLAAEDYEAALIKLKKREGQMKLEFKATCAPQYNRIGLELKLSANNKHQGKGCLGGQGFMFLSHDGKAQACGYLPLEAGDFRQNTIEEIYKNSELFLRLRDKKNYEGKCGQCQYWNICGGCRARAHAKGNFLGPESLCPYQPQQDKL